MKTQQLHWTFSAGWNSKQSEYPGKAPTFVLVFGGRQELQNSPALASLAKIFPAQTFLGCSTAGEIVDTRVHDDTVVATAVWLERSHIETAVVSVSSASQCSDLGRRLAGAISHARLVHALVLSDGTHVNGTELLDGLTKTLPKGVGLSGGLSGDGTAMKETVVCHRGIVASGQVLIIGFYGDLQMGSGAMGGWGAFGPERIITRSSDNVLYELDDAPALALYKTYLGRHAADLPSSALLFPLLLTTPGQEPVVRTILGIDEATGAMTFAGNTPAGASVRLMRASFDRIIEGAFGAAEASNGRSGCELAILISCIGRKLILKQRLEEETEAVREVLGPRPVLTGFYSYGELARGRGERCQLHNQTMAVTTLHEG
jgi:hypothetical protein